MTVDDGVELGRRLKPRHEGPADPRRRRQYDAVAGRQAKLPFRQIDDAHPVLLEGQSLHWRGEPHPRAPCRQIGEGRVDKGRGQGRVSDPRAIGAPPFGQRLGNHRPRQLSRALCCLRVEGG